VPIIVYIQPDGMETSTEVRSGSSVMHGAIHSSVPGIEAECGGALNCATCHVYLEPDWVERVPPASEDEEMLLEGVAAERRPESRLSCQIKVNEELDGLRVHVPGSQF